jgi:hypothetical protein
MKTITSKTAAIFIRTDEQTKQEFLDNVKKSCFNQNTVVEILIKNWNRKNKKREKEIKHL